MELREGAAYNLKKNGWGVKPLFLVWRCSEQRAFLLWIHRDDKQGDNVFFSVLQVLDNWNGLQSIFLDNVNCCSLLDKAIGDGE
jgi:hypothetical protein